MENSISKNLSLRALQLFKLSIFFAKNLTSGFLIEEEESLC